MQAQPFTVVVGPSGCGKSSVVLAGLVPAMRTAGRLVVTMTPGDRPWAALATALGQVSALDHAALVTRDALSAEGGLPTALLALSENDCVVVVIDQLEELWTLADESERLTFTAALAQVASRCAAVRTVATIRADWFDRPLGDPALGALAAQSTFGVTPLSADELTEAIVGPLDRSGVRLEAGLTRGSSPMRSTSRVRSRCCSSHLPSCSTRGKERSSPPTTTRRWEVSPGRSRIRPKPSTPA